MQFKLKSRYEPKGDQVQAIEKLYSGIKTNQRHQTLLGATGSGKTFTVANVINKVNKPTLVISHNKTLAAQLYNELKNFFPNNKVEYFVSYYDYYQPESYIPSTSTYIAKDLSINKEIEKLRLSAITSLATQTKDTIVVSSVSCIYGLGNPELFKKGLLSLKVGDKISQKKLLLELVRMLYKRSDRISRRGTFRARGDIIEIFLTYADWGYRLEFFDDEIENITIIEPESGLTQKRVSEAQIFPNNLFVLSKEILNKVVKEIEKDLDKQILYFEKQGLAEEGKRLKERTELDIEMLTELGYCTGIENYSRYFDNRKSGERPYCLIDYFPKDFLMVVDESHVTIPQIRSMYAGDRARKINLIEHGFRLPSAIDNRPLEFSEFENLINQIIYVSATPSDYELNKSEGEIVEQIIRPTGLLDPEIYVKEKNNQIDDIVEEIRKVSSRKERILITTLTKSMAEKLTKYLKEINIKTVYIHSEIKTLERVEILTKLRKGIYDVLVGVNLLREGLDLPEVSLVAILDADKEGFLRNYKSLIQTIGRAARNKKGKVIMYAEKITESMKKAINETKRRRKIQIEYNKKNNIIPESVLDKKEDKKYYTSFNEIDSYVADEKINYMNKEEIKKEIQNLEEQMEYASKKEMYQLAEKLKDQINSLKEYMDVN